MDKPKISDLASAKTYIKTLERDRDEMQAEIDRLNHIIRLANKARFGSTSEKARYIMDDQISLFNEAEIFADETAPEARLIEVEKHKRKKKRTKEELVAALPVQEIVMKLPEEERVCDICESDVRPIGKTFIRRELNIIPAKAFVTEIYQESYACDECEKESDQAHIIKAPVPVPVIKRGLASPSAAAHVFYQKFVNAMPLYRQEKDWERFGVFLLRATMANWIIYISMNWLMPLWIQMKTQLLLSEVILADDYSNQNIIETSLRKTA
jgi:transposase